MNSARKWLVKESTMIILTFKPLLMRLISSARSICERSCRRAASGCEHIVAVEAVTSGHLRDALRTEGVFRVDVNIAVESALVNGEVQFTASCANLRFTAAGSP